MIDVDDVTTVVDGDVMGHVPTEPSAGLACQKQPHIAWVYADLLLLAALSILLPVIVLLPIPVVRVPVGFVAVLAAPGYALLTAIFPRRSDIDGIARAAMSIGGSIAVLVLLTLLINALPGGIRLWSMVIALSSWTLCLCAVSAYGRYRLQLPEELVPLRFSGVRSWSQSRPRWRILHVAIVCVLVLGITVVVSTFVATPRLTEFYLLGAEGLAEQYPREVSPDEKMALRIGVTNREAASHRYRVVITTKGRSLAETEWFTLANGATREQQLSTSLPDVGDDQEVILLLFTEGRAEPYRQLHLWLNVRLSTAPAITR